MHTHKYIVHVHICVILYECTIMCVYAWLYCMYVQSVCSTCAYSSLYVSIVQVNYISKAVFQARGFTIKNLESFTPGVVVLPRKLFCCCIHKR